MYLNFRKLVLLSSLSFVLSACGGSSGEGSGKNNDNYIPPSNSTVSGQFLNSSDTGKYFSTEEYPDYDQYGNNASHCYQNYNDYYFETARTMVFGNPSLPESDFKQAATWVENNLDSALTSMGVTEQAFFEAKGNIRISRLKEIRNWLSQKAYPDFSYPDEFDSWDYDQIDEWTTSTVKSLSDAEIIHLSLNDPFIQKSEAEIVLEDKVYVCLHENTNLAGWGEGTPLGITIGAESINVPSNINKLIQHELIHTIQFAVSADLDGFKLPRWFSEGQAVYLSGMNLAKKSEHQDYNPTLVVYYTDEYGDPSDAYEHYGLAYQYLADANTQASIIAMMNELKNLNVNWSTQFNSSLAEHHNYVEAFNRNIKQQNGSALSVVQYRDDYHSLMATYAN